MNTFPCFRLPFLGAVWAGCALLSQAADDEKKALLPIPDKLVVLTFDDCNKSDRAFVAGVVKAHGFGATFFVTEGLGFLRNKKHYTTWTEIRELHDLGFEIGNHTRSHPNVTRLRPEEFEDELEHIDRKCAEHGIPKPVTFCFPGFHDNAASVKVLAKRGFQFSRRGVGPEYRDKGKGARGPAYDPRQDHPLLVPTTGYSGPDWGMEDLQWAVGLARGGKIAVLCYHGVPAIEHAWVNTDPADFKKQMQYLKDQGCTVIAMRDLSRYVDSRRRPEDPYAPIRARLKAMKSGKAATP